MEIKRSLRLVGLFTFILVLAIGLSACERSKSEAPVTVPSATVASGLPTQNLGIFETLTPVVDNGGQTTPVAVETTVPVSPVSPAFTATAALIFPEATAVIATPVPVIPTVGPNPNTYTLQAGEFPYCIARRFDINPVSLLEYNGLTASTQLKEGAVLKLPKDAPAFPGNRALKFHPTQYTVASGDTLGEIACAYGDVSPEMIAAANGMSAPYVLNAGAVIQIP